VNRDGVVDEAQVSRWLARYIQVWKAGDHSAVARLFTEDAVYYPDPFVAPRRGHAEIAEYWRESGDEPDAFEAEYRPLVVTGDVAVTQGFSRYFDAGGSRVDKEYANVFVLRFAPDGRCAEYREWYMLRGADGGPADP
jgi:ketosteroid isomerase-like protein